MMDSTKWFSFLVLFFCSSVACASNRSLRSSSVNVSGDHRYNHFSRSNSSSKPFFLSTPKPTGRKGSARSARDQQLLAVFELMISSLDMKLQKVESFDSTVKALLDRIDALESRIDKSTNRTDELISIFARVDRQLRETKENAPRHGQLDANTLNSCVLRHLNDDLRSINETINFFDASMQKSLQHTCENLTALKYLTKNIQFALEDGTRRRGSSGPPARDTPPDLAEEKSLKPLPRRGSRFQISTVDDLFPKSVEFITQTQRQERAIGEIDKNNVKSINGNRVELASFEAAKTARDEGGTTTSTTERSGGTPQGEEEEVVEGTASALEEEVATEPTEAVPSGSTTARSVGDKRSEIKKGGIIFPSIRNKPTHSNSSSSSNQESENVTQEVKAYSCLDLLNSGEKKSGVYYLQIRGTTYWFLKVYCEQETGDGGWTVIQRRDDFGDARENFNRDWNDYKNGFGDPAKEFWLGNENIFMLTNNEEYSLRIELEDFEGEKRYAQYSHFKIHSEGEYYKLEIDGYEGNAGDSLNDPWYGSNNSPFSTYNKDNDRSSLNCASMLKGGWWWKSCGRGLNGLYLSDPQDLTARQGIVWFRWRGWDYTLKKASMMIRPRGIGTNS